MTQLIKTNCPRDCYDGCGIVVEPRANGRHRVLGDPDHPVSRGKLCSKCCGGLQRRVARRQCTPAISAQACRAQGWQ